MSANCGTPGFGVEGHLSEQIIMGRMTDHNRVDLPVVAAAIEGPCLMKLGGDGKTLEQLTATSETPFAFMGCSKDAGVTRVGVFTQVDVNRSVMERLFPAIDFDVMVGKNSRIFYKKPIIGGAE